MRAKWDGGIRGRRGGGIEKGGNRTVLKNVFE